MVQKILSPVFQATNYPLQGRQDQVSSVSLGVITFLLCFSSWAEIIFGFQGTLEES